MGAGERSTLLCRCASGDRQATGSPRAARVRRGRCGIGRQTTGRNVARSPRRVPARKVKPCMTVSLGSDVVLPLSESSDHSLTASYIPVEIAHAGATATSCNTTSSRAGTPRFFSMRKNLLLSEIRAALLITMLITNGDSRARMNERLRRLEHLTIELMPKTHDVPLPLVGAISGGTKRTRRRTRRSTCRCLPGSGVWSVLYA